MAELTLWQETALKVRELQVRFDAFETENKMSGNYFNEFDEELEEGRVSLEKLEKRVRELETDLPELIAERVATLKTENAELRHHLNSVIDAVNNITRIWNEAIGDEQSTIDNEVLPEAVGEQSMEDNEVLPEAVGEQSMEDNEVLPEAVGEQSMEDNEVLTLPQDEHPQLTLEEVYNKYQSQPQTEEEWEEMNKAIKAAVAYENSLSNRTKIRLAKTDWTSGSPQ